MKIFRIEVLKYASFLALDSQLTPIERRYHILSRPKASAADLTRFSSSLKGSLRTTRNQLKSREILIEVRQASRMKVSPGSAEHGETSYK